MNTTFPLPAYLFHSCLTPLVRDVMEVLQAVYEQLASKQLICGLSFRVSGHSPVCGATI